MDHNPYLIFNINLGTSLKTWNSDCNVIKINASKIENRIRFKIKTRYYLELLTPEATVLVGSANNKITKGKNSKHVFYLEITKVFLVHCNISNNDYQPDSRVLHAFVANKSFGQSLDISPKIFIFLKTFNSEK